MGINIYETLTMLKGVKAAKPIPSFLKDTFFPTSEGDFFPTKKVTVDYEKDSTEKLAPAVVKGSVPVQRDDFEAHEYTAPLIAPSMTLSVEQLDERLFNESIVSGMTAEQKEAQLLADDLKKLGAMITRTEEYMAAQVILNNAYTVKQYLDKYGTAFAQDFSINFYGEGNNSNQAVYSGNGWTTSSTNIFSDIKIMCDWLAKKGRAATDLIMGSTAASTFMANSEVQKQLDNRRIRIADEMRPEMLAPGVAYIGRFDFEGYVLDVYSYSATYTALDGTETPFFDADKIAVTSKSMGRTAYGAIKQYENGSKTANTYAAARVPHVIVNEHDGVKELVLKSRPLVMPKQLNASIVSDVV